MKCVGLPFLALLVIGRSKRNSIRGRIISTSIEIKVICLYFLEIKFWVPTTLSFLHLRWTVQVAGRELSLARLRTPSFKFILLQLMHGFGYEFLSVPLDLVSTSLQSFFPRLKILIGRELSNLLPILLKLLNCIWTDSVYGIPAAICVVIILELKEIHQFLLVVNLSCPVYWWFQCFNVFDVQMFHNFILDLFIPHFQTESHLWPFCYTYCVVHTY